MAENSTYKLKGGKWIIPKDPNDDLFYAYDATDDLLLTPTGPTTASSVVAIVQGVTITVPAVVQGNLMIAKLSGLDVSSDDAVNCCTFRITCANTEQFDRSIYFSRKDK